MDENSFQNTESKSLETRLAFSRKMQRREQVEFEDRIKEQIEKIKADPPTFSIGVSCAAGELSYCLARKWNKKTEIILSKKSHDKDSFNFEVERLAEYFNATIYEEKQSSSCCRI